MLRDEFNRLMKLFQEGSEGKPVQLDEIFRESLAFFERLNEQIKAGDPDAQKEALTMMKEMHAQINTHVKKIAASTGMTEEQLATYAENPGNFSPDEWAALQQARNQMSKAGHNLVQSVKELDESSRKILAQPASPAAPKKPATPIKRAKKSDWNRS